LALLTVLALPVQAANPREDLLALVPDDVGFCLVVSDLRGHVERLRQAAWVKALRESDFARSLAKSPEARKLRAFEDTVHKKLGADLARLRDDILGDAVVYAYRPGPPDAPQGERGLVLLWARDVKLLIKVIEVVNADVKTPDQLVYKQVTYFRRVDSRGQPLYYYQSEHLLAFSSREDMVREVIERHRTRLGNAKKGAPSLVDQLRRLGADKALAALWFNPRPFEPHLRQQIDAVQGPASQAARACLSYWQALEGAVLALSIHNQVEIKLAVRAATDKLPQAARRFFHEASKASDVWNHFPAHALVAFGGRVDFVALGQFVADFMPREARKAFRNQMGRSLDAGLGLNFASDVAPYLGPDWGFCMMAPLNKSTLVPLMTWALRVRPGPKEPFVDQQLLQGLNALAFAAVLGGNQANQAIKLRLRTQMQDKIEVRYVDSKIFPAGFKPAFALKEGFLLLATAPEAIRVFTQRTAKADAQGDVPVLRVSLQEWVKFLRARRESIIDHVMAKDRISREEARQQLDKLLWGLELFQGLELTQRTGAGQVTWTLTLRPAP
jgi:hypothetical protein